MAVIRGRNLVLAGALAALTFSGASMAQPMRGPAGPAGTPMLTPPMMHFLGLDQDQAKKVSKIQREFAREQAKRAAEMRKAQWKLNKAVAAPAPDAKKVEKLFDKVSGKRKEMLMEQVETRNEVLDTLNDEQAKRYKEIHKRRMGMPPERPERGDDD